MPKKKEKKKSDNWQHDCPEKEKKKAKRGATLLPREERRKKKMQFKLRVFV